VEPFHLFDCCMENDGAAALILMDAQRAADCAQKPVYLLGAAAGSGPRFGSFAHNSIEYASGNFGTVAPDLYRMAGVEPKDVGVVQAYDSFTGGVLMALAEHGFFPPEAANDFLVLDNLVAKGGRLPLNTSGGNLAECYVHGFELVLEAVRQVRGTSSNQAARNDVALVVGGPMVSPVSDLLLGSRDARSLSSAPTSAPYLPPGLQMPVAETGRLIRAVLGGIAAKEKLLRAALLPLQGVGSSGLNGSATSLPRNSIRTGSRCRPRDESYSWERVWHPVHPALKGSRCPYLAVAGGTAPCRWPASAW
jgi:hypothetical protein